jgi:hypothetical protein
LYLKINGADIAAMPSAVQVTILDLDDAESTTRTADGTLHRDRVAVKRQIELTFNALRMDEISPLLQQISDIFFDFTYPDPMVGAYITKKVYVGDRPANIPFEKDGVLYWSGFKMTLTER